jgi:hypothetical protein
MPKLYDKRLYERAGTSSASPMARAANPHARARTPSSPETHLELHNRLADNREQPRRQRDHIRRELRVRRTGGDRRRRRPVPRQLHRHEQLEPLQRIASYRPVCTPVAV